MFGDVAKLTRTWPAADLPPIQPVGAALKQLCRYRSLQLSAFAGTLNYFQLRMNETADGCAKILLPPLNGSAHFQLSQRLT
jgi:hypothetical protein